MDYKSFSLGFFAAAAFGTVVCMPLSAAGLVTPTILLCVAVFFFATLGFIFAVQNAKQEREALKMEMMPTGVEAAIQDAVLLLEAYEAAQRGNAPEAELQEKQRSFTEAANTLVMRFGEVQATAKETAMVSVKKALQAQKDLARYSEQNAPEAYLNQLQTQAETLARIAVRDLRTMLREQKS